MLVGGLSILAFFGPSWPILNAPSGPRVTKKCPTTVSPCYTYGNPCPNIRRACSINFLQFLNTPGSRVSGLVTFKSSCGVDLIFLRRSLGSGSQIKSNFWFSLVIKRDCLHCNVWIKYKSLFFYVGISSWIELSVLLLSEFFSKFIWLAIKFMSLKNVAEHSGFWSIFSFKSGIT